MQKCEERFLNGDRVSERRFLVVDLRSGGPGSETILADVFTIEIAFDCLSFSITFNAEQNKIIQEIEILNALDDMASDRSKLLMILIGSGRPATICTGAS